MHLHILMFFSRNVTGFSRERCLLFLRYHCDQDESGHWKVKVCQEYVVVFFFFLLLGHAAATADT